MARIAVLDPTAPAPATDPDPGPPAGALDGKVVGFRLDHTWRSFEWVVDEWAQQLRGEGADVRLWWAGNRIGEEGEQTTADLERFADEVDVAVVGLGN